MNSVDELLTAYVADCTPPHAPSMGDLAPATSSFAPVARTHIRSWVAIGASVAAAVLVVAGVAVVREQLMTSHGGSPAIGIPAESSDGVVILGTWVPRDKLQPVADPENTGYITFAPDGTVLAWDGCNRVRGVYRTDPQGVLSVEFTSTTAGTCASGSPRMVPLDSPMTLEPARHSLVMLDPVTGDRVGNLRRPDELGLLAELEADQYGRLQLRVITVSSPSCRYRVDRIQYRGINQVTVSSADVHDECAASTLRASIETIELESRQLSVTEPATLTVRGLMSAPVAVPISVTDFELRGVEVDATDCPNGGGSGQPEPELNDLGEITEVGVCPPEGGGDAVWIGETDSRFVPVLNALALPDLPEGALEQCVNVGWGHPVVYGRTATDTYQFSVPVGECRQEREGTGLLSAVDTWRYSDQN